MEFRNHMLYILLLMTSLDVDGLYEADVLPAIGISDVFNISFISCVLSLCEAWPASVY